MKTLTICSFFLAVSLFAQPYTVTGITCKDAAGAIDTHKIAPGQTQTCTASLAWIGNPPTTARLTIGTVTYDFSVSNAAATIAPYVVASPLTLAPAVLTAVPVTGTSTVTFTVTYPTGAP
jgi:hypothetical protein